jgi:putative CocE/NonD family hydrolase
MKKIIGVAMLCLGALLYLPAQKLYFPQKAKTDSTEIAKAVSSLARQLTEKYRDNDRWRHLSNLFRYQALSGEYGAASRSIHALREITPSTDENRDVLFIQFELYTSTMKELQKMGRSFNDIYTKIFTESIKNLDDRKSLYVSTAFITLNGVEQLKKEWESNLSTTKDDSIDLTTAMALCNSYFLFKVYEAIEPPSIPLLKADDNRRYIINDSILVPSGKASIAAILVRRRMDSLPLPAALQFTIYAEKNNFNEAKLAAAHGYAGIIAYTRGKGLSPDQIVPYEHEVTDVNSVIDWIVRQPWCNKKVGMYGGSYNGFSQWAAAKQIHPALKTIVPYVAAMPGLGLPMENNVFLNANYGWAFYVTNNKYLDNHVYYDPSRWRRMQQEWFESGVAYRKLDSVDGTPNRLFQRYIQHPAFDLYWQSMVPYKQDYSRINIPVLSITGYYDDGQISALHYLKEHYKYNKNAHHYLIIGPYNHLGAQRGGSPFLTNYAVDPVALINTSEITFAWLDHIMKAGKRPAILKDKINFQVMGANQWLHAPTLAKMSNSTLSFYLNDSIVGMHHLLGKGKPSKVASLKQVVDFSDRKSTNNDYYPNPIVKTKLEISNGISYVSDPFTEAVVIAGQFSASLKVKINKRDMDIGLVLYEVLPDGKYFHLAYFLGRASYANDISRRELLQPGKKETITLERSRLVCRRMEKGSRLLLLVNINKNSFAQVNYGTGKDVSEETIADAGEPLEIEWFNDSFINVPVRR